MLGVLPGIVGTIQATEAIKLILGIGEPLIGRLLLFDALHAVPRDASCERTRLPGLRTHEITELIDYDEFCGIGGGEEAAARHSGDHAGGVAARAAAATTST